MKFRSIQATLALGMSFQLGIGSAAAPAIGTVLAKGTFRLDNSTVSGNATLFEGSTLESGAGSSSVQLASGARVSLAADSRGKLFGDRMVLEKGGISLEDGTGFRLVALGLTIQPDRGSSTGRLVIDSPRRIRVAALTGSFRILNTSGQLIANMAPGVSLSFEPQQGPSNVARVSGCLENKSGHYVLTDSVTKVTVEIAGNGVNREAGNTVEVTGAMDPTATPASEASQLIRVREIKRVARGCNPAAIAAAAGAGGAAAGGAAAGGAAGASGGVAISTIAVIGGVAAAAAVGGLAAANALPGQDDTPSASR
ncbi:MAG: hypothetical protein ABI811_05175 [Acidobacteriota bacterium]